MYGLERKWGHWTDWHYRESLRLYVRRYYVYYKMWNNNINRTINVCILYKSWVMFHSHFLLFKATQNFLLQLYFLFIQHSNFKIRMIPCHILKFEFYCFIFMPVNNNRVFNYYVKRNITNWIQTESYFFLMLNKHLNK